MEGERQDSVGIAVRRKEREGRGSRERGSPRVGLYPVFEILTIPW